MAWSGCRRSLGRSTGWGLNSGETARCAAPSGPGIRDLGAGNPIPGFQVSPMRCHGLCSPSRRRRRAAWAGLRSCPGRGVPSPQGSVLVLLGVRWCPRLTPEMTASKRVAKELEELLKQPPPYLGHLSCNDANVLVWHAVLLPEQPPYHLRAFNLRIDFPKDYPLKPPMLKFTTKIYHPNVGEDGQVCLPLISKENWKPHTKTCQVLEALNILVNRPNLGEPMRLELANLLTQNPELFRRKAEEFTLQFGVDRPS